MNDVAGAPATERIDVMCAGANGHTRRVKVDKPDARGKTPR